MSDLGDIFLPTKVQLREATLAFSNIYNYVKNIKVYEDMCKPYITAVVTIFDNDNFINRLNMETGGLKGQPMTFSFWAGDEDKTYSQLQYVFEVKELPSPNNLRYIVYEITTVGPAYYNDRSNTVQDSPVLKTVTSAAQSIHNQYIGGDAPLRMLTGSLGMIAKKEFGSYTVNNIKPFKAMEHVLKRATFSAYPSNSPVYFRDRDSYVIAPLEMLFATASAQYHFEQKSTWGIDYKNIFTAHNAIITASTVTNDKEGGQGSGAKSAAAASQSLAIWDQKGMKLVQELAASPIPMPAKALNNLKTAVMIASKYGGIPNVLPHDSSRNDLSNDPAMHAREEQVFQAAVADAARYLVKVPIRGGLHCTIGQGVHLTLRPPVGDQQTSEHAFSGVGLISRLCHECWFDKRLVQATTTMQVVYLGTNNALS